MFDYELKISIDSKEELPSVNNQEGEWRGDDEYRYKDLYYGFSVKDTGIYPSGKKFMDRVFTMHGTSTLQDLKDMITKLTGEVITSDIPPKYFKSGLALLQKLLVKQNEEDFDDNMEYTVSRDYPAFGVTLYLCKKPAPVKKDPEPDGCVTGAVWSVSLKLKNKKDKCVVPLTVNHPVFCIKPESAVHETLDSFMRHYPDLFDHWEVDGLVEVQKAHDTVKVPYIVIKDNSK